MKVKLFFWNKYSKNEFIRNKSAVLLFVFFVSFRFSLISQTPGEWTWMHGDNTPNSPGVFGTQGMATPANKPPALYEPCEWTDNNGNFWLLGGLGNGSSIYASLWKYDVVANQWTWMKGTSAINQNGAYGTIGIPSSANYPGARALGATTWVDTSGNLWLFGGKGYDAIGGLGPLNDLWKYDVAVNVWTWINGSDTINDPGSYGTQGVSVPSNLPPSRWEISCSWIDNVGNLWLYGSQGAGGYLGDLWRYNIASNEWTWMHGASTVNAPPVYGTQGVAASANTPGGRMVYCSWTDLASNLWLFGGGDFFTVKNDLWKYNIAANQWTWVKGPNTVNDPGNYGAKCVSANTNMPPARFENRARVRDVCGNFWNFGGGFSSGGNVNFSDLWHYNVSTDQWTWVSGDNILNQAAVYGTQGLSSPANKPGAKMGSVAWMDNKGYLWVFGGWGIGGVKYNDLFRYVPCPCTSPSLCSCSTSLSATATASNVLCNPQCTGTAAVTATSGTSPYTYAWSNAQSTSAISGLCAGTYSVFVTDATTSIATATVIITQPTLLTATATITNAACGSNNGNASVTANGGTFGYTYSWEPGGQTTSTATGLGSGTYTATVTDANGCIQTQTVTIISSGSVITTNQSVSICTGYTYTLPGGTVVSTGGTYNDTFTSVNGCDSIITTTLTVSPNPTAAAFSNATITQGQVITLTASGGGTYSWSNGTKDSFIIVVPLVTTVYCVTVTDSNNCTDTACVTVTIDPIDCSNAGKLYLPNTFSPNGDKENDFLQVYYGNMVCIKTFKLIIYNRWGEKVFETTNPREEWDGTYRGKPESTAVFVYYLEATLLSGEEIIRKGNISLLQ